MKKPATAVTPSISFDIDAGILEIKGKSYPENVHEVYADLLDLINQYAEKPQAKTQLVFEWLYYNTASSKMIAKILLAFKKMDTEVSVVWICKPEFTVMIENGELYKECLDIDFEIRLQE